MLRKRSQNVISHLDLVQTFSVCLGWLANLNILLDLFQSKKAFEVENSIVISCLKSTFWVGKCQPKHTISGLNLSQKLE